jgi:hypothetical protein
MQVNYTLFAACLQAATSLVIANGRVSTMDETSVRLQVMELARDLYAEAHSRSRSLSRQ